MCGISGFIGDFDVKVLASMGKAIEFRGPDNTDIWFQPENRIGFVHTRLSIIDISEHANQPLWDASGSVVIIFNGEIYNYKALRKELLADGYKFNTASDTEVLVNLYLRDGFEMLPKLNGIFAFALWDARKCKLFIARDGQGVKPLYFSSSSKGVVFASEIKAILQEKSVDRTLDYEAINYHLTYLWAPTPHTMLKSVKKLEPGHALLIHDGQIEKKWKFYDLPYHQPIARLSEKDAIAGTLQRLTDAVRSQLVSDVPVGAFLSGGLDSSAVVALAKEAMPEKNIKCFTIDFNDNRLAKEGMTEDLPYAQRVAKHLGVELHTVTVGSDMIMDLEKMIYHLDEPQADPAPLNAMYICEMAKKQGIKVLLSGAGGDDIFTGYRRHYALSSEKYWSWLPKAERRWLKWVSSRLPKNHPLMRRIAKAFQYADLSGDERLVSYFYWMNPESTQKLYTEEFAACLKVKNPAKPLLKTLSNLPANTHILNKMLYLEGKHFLVDHNLNYTDKVGMAEGVEVRVPLLDPDLIDYVTSLPVNFKQRGREGKWIFKKAMEPYLPLDVIYRPKTGFGAPLRHWLNNDLRPLVDDVLSSESLSKRGIFNAQEVQKLISLDRLGLEDVSYPIFSLICIELWCRMFIDKPTPSFD